MYELEDQNLFLIERQQEVEYEHEELLNIYENLKQH